MFQRLGLFSCELLIVLLVFVSALPTVGQQLTEADRKRNRDILVSIKDEVVKSYFDPTFRGIDLEAKFREAEQELRRAANNTDAFVAIFNFLENLQDSHTRFNPPSRKTKFQHEWIMQMVGDNCFVTEVMPGSDGAKKGLKPGDQIISIEGLRPTTSEFDRIVYFLYRLNPLPDFNLVIQTPTGERKNLTVVAKRIEGRAIIDVTDYNTYMNLVRASENYAKLNSHRLVRIDGVTIWKMPQFDLATHQVDDLMGKVNKEGSLIIDLRGNGGGNEETLLRLIGNVFSEDVKIGDIVRRKETRPLVAKSVGKRAFGGRLIVLIDRDSGSASEVFARVVQLEKRGTVIGDRSGGKVMRSIYYPKKYGMDVIVAYGVSVTDADLVMTDGKSLERNGVHPDTLMLPKATDLRDKHDPVLSHALSLLGVSLDPKKAGEMFPFKWK